jgi:peptidoglycan/LPS O-acetylase OafA/YrhL
LTSAGKAPRLHLAAGGRIDSLTALRFFAAFGVVCHHLGYGKGIGSLGVTFFFVLSGFILTYNYFAILSRPNRRSLASYAAARIARIYPVHLATFLFSIPLVVAAEKHTVGETLANLLLLQSFWPSGLSVFSYNSVSWTLSDEMFFYIALPAILVAAARTGLASRPRALAAGGGILFAAAVVVAVALQGRMAPYSRPWWLVYIAPQFRITDFIVGVLLGLGFLAVSHRAQPVAGSGSRGLYTALEALALGSVVLSYRATAYKYDTLSMGLYYLPAFALVIAVFARQGGWFSSILSSRPLVHLGEISYSVYMLHHLVIRYIATYFSRKVYLGTVSARQIVAHIFVVVVIVALSDALYRYFEDPVRRIIHRRMFPAIRRWSGEANEH